MDSSLMCTQQPPFQQRHHLMHPGKEVLAFRLKALHMPVVRVAAEPHVGVQSICSHDATRLNHVSDEAVQAGFGQIGNASQTNTADPFPVFFSGDDDYGLVLSQPSDNARFLTAPVGFVHLNCTTQPITTGSHHSSTKFVQPCPRRHIAPQTKHLLQTYGTRSVLLTGNMPDCPKPHPQRLSCVLKNGPCSHRSLIAASSTDQSSPRARPASRAAASWTNKAFGPSKLEQIIPTGVFGRKPILKFKDCSWVIFHTRIRYMLYEVESIE